MTFKYFNVKNGLTTGNITLHAGNSNVVANTFIGNLNATGLANLGSVANIKISGGAANYVLKTDGTGNLSWVAQSGGGGGGGSYNPVVDTFTGTGSQTAFELSVEPSTIYNTIVNIDGVSQLHSAYSLTGATITFSSAPISGAVIEVLILATTATGGTPGGSNTQVQFNDANAFGGSSGLTFDKISTTLTANNFVVTTSANLGNLVTANYYSGNGSLLTSITGANVTGTVANATYATSAGSATTAGTVTTAAQPNITSVGTLTSVSVTGNISASNANLGNLTTSNYFAGVLTTGAQPNITSTGTLTSLTVTGNANVGNINTTDAVISGNATITGNLTVSGTTEYTNVTNLYVKDPIIELGGGANGAPLTTNDGKDRGTLLHYYNSTAIDAFMGWDNSNAEFAFGSNVSVTNEVVTFNSLGNLRAGYFIGNGSQLTGITSAAYANYIANGTSNVNIVTANGNVTVGVSGNANIVTVTGTGVNVSGTLNATSNITAGNANLGNLTTSNYFSGNGSLLTSITGGNVTGQVANALVAGTVYTAAQPNITSVGTLTSLTITGNVTAGNATLGNLTTSNYFSGNGSLLTSITGANVTGTVSSATTATTAGTVTTAAQPNITSVGTLASLTVTGNISAGNANLGNLITANYTTAVLTTGAQPNITSTGTLTSLTVTGNISSGNANLGNLTTSNYFAGTLTTAAQPNVTSIGTLSNLTSNGTVNFTNASNVSLGAIGNVKVTGGTSGQFLITDGAGNLSFTTLSVSSSSISNGNSNVNIATANGNVTISSAGNANIVTVTGTGVNVAGTLNITGISTLGNVGNVKITGGSNGQFLQTDGTGNLTWSSSASGMSLTVDAFTGDGTTTSFTLSTAPTSKDYTIVSLAGTFQPRSTYTVTGTTITFSSAPANTTPIEVTTFASGGGGGGGTGYSIANGTSNVNIATANGNVTTSVGGSANVFVVTSTGTNVNGTLNVTGISTLGNVGNVKITGGSSNQVLTTDGAGNLTWATASGGTSNARVMGYNLVFGL